MSLLLRKPLQISLFPGELRLDGKHLKEAVSFAIDTTDPASQALQILEAQLIAHHDKVAQHQQVKFLVSDHFGVVQILPWQDHLVKQVEVDQYANICLEQQSLSKDESWTVHADLAVFRQPGIIYGFTENWIKNIYAIGEKHNLKLMQMLPLSAQLFYRAKKVVGKHSKLTLIGEAKRITAFVLEHGHVQSSDVEPVLGNQHDAIQRILRRAQQNIEVLKQVALWGSDPGLQAEMQEVIAKEWPDTKCLLLAPDAWRLG